MRACRVSRGRLQRETEATPIYLRVSTSEQTTDNQRRELLAVAARHQWEMVKVFDDAGMSGAKGRDQRPGLDAVMKAVARREVDMVAAWSVDRLGRLLIDLIGFLRELHVKGVRQFLHQESLDTLTSSGRAMFQMMGVFAEFERAMIPSVSWQRLPGRASKAPSSAGGGSRIPTRRRLPRSVASGRRERGSGASPGTSGRRRHGAEGDE